MSESVIQVENLTKDYGNGRGIFNISMDIRKGEIFGFLGTNGSGKTTTIRSLMGFIKPDGGKCSVLGLDSRQQRANIMKSVSYIPGEIAFPDYPTGTDFLKNQAKFLGVTDFTYMNHIIKELSLDTSANLKRMSKGMKQKTAITAALMGEKEILILDEPTTGLDPLMRDAFINLIREEKSKGHTIFMSGHIFEEIEEICDRAAMIKDGHLVDITDLYKMNHSRDKRFVIEFVEKEDLDQFEREWENAKPADGVSCMLEIAASEITELMKSLKNYKVKSLQEKHFSLEQHFMEVYEAHEND